MFEELNSQELMATEGGSFLGFLAAGAIIIGTATIVASDCRRTPVFIERKQGFWS